MKKICFLCFIWVITNSFCSAQKISNDEIIQIAKLVLTENKNRLIELNTYFMGDTCILFSTACGCDYRIPHCEERLEIEYVGYTIKIWPADHVFFHDAERYIQLYECELDKNRFYAHTLLKVGNNEIDFHHIQLIKEQGNWKKIHEN